MADNVGASAAVGDTGFDGVKLLLATAVGLDVHEGVSVPALRIDTLLEHVALCGAVGDAVDELLSDRTGLAVQLALEEDVQVPPNVQVRVPDGVHVELQALVMPTVCATVQLRVRVPVTEAVCDGV